MRSNGTPQQTEECSGATAMQLQPQQCANTPMQRQHIAIEAVQEIAAEAQTPLQARAKLCTASGQLCHANERSGKQRSAENA
jgi:hypothetical protein